MNEWSEWAFDFFAYGKSNFTHYLTSLAMLHLLFAYY